MELEGAQKGLSQLWYEPEARPRLRGMKRFLMKGRKELQMAKPSQVGKTESGARELGAEAYPHLWPDGLCLGQKSSLCRKNFLLSGTGQSPEGACSLFLPPQGREPMTRWQSTT